MRDTSVAPHIATTGVWELAIGDVLRRLARPDDVVVDVGANFGYHTLLLSTVVPLRKDAFHLFEPEGERAWASFGGSLG